MLVHLSLLPVLCLVPSLVYQKRYIHVPLGGERHCEATLVVRKQREGKKLGRFKTTEHKRQATALTLIVLKYVKKKKKKALVTAYDLLL